MASSRSTRSRTGASASAGRAGAARTPADGPALVRAAHRGAVRIAAASTAATALALCGPVVGTAAAADPAPQTTDRHVVVLVNFRNSALSDPGADRTKAVSNFFGPTGSLAAYYAANSDNRMTVVPAKGDGVFGPFTLDVDSSGWDKSGCDSGKVAELARRAIPDLTYDHLSIVMPSTKACAWWGLGSQPGPTTWFQEGAVNDLAAIVHEAGHNLGFAHEERQVCTAGSFSVCTADEYSRRTPMGAGGSKKGLSAPELLAQKWLTAQQVSTPRTTTTVHLAPLHAPANASGTRAIDLPLGTKGDRIVVEYRTPDSGLDGDVPRGVDVFRVPQGKYDHAVMIGNTKQEDKTTAGSFTADTPLADTSAHISLSVVRMTDQGADVRVDLGADQAPNVSATTPTPAPVQSTQQADDTRLIGSTTTATPSPAAAADGPALASTGAKVLTPTLIGGTLLAVGGAAVLLGKRRTRRRRH
ncbi:hypothetical protein OG689_03875 [Kitasatospora sp. NBC_00240]|uniref:hypothetical protein n=1 Tax=Kitasatospora sp. NBC_00240 TaxID=2903567 RepID=UPI00224F70C3|nr:hypothetical protein [Kitasatospora sp. NBC_00240]MCX5208442.1 hypothetical protein [Kitasatospora sp. NBC_00240]